MRGADHLFHYYAAALLQLVVARRRGDEERLVGQPFKLCELQRAVVEGAGQAEAVVYERLFSGAVAVVHPLYLRQGRVRLVYDEQIRRLEEV